jgi:hypothetical protein
MLQVVAEVKSFNESSSFIRPSTALPRYPPNMPAPERKKISVIQCRGRTRIVSCAAQSAPVSVVVRCAICLERRAYIVATEVFQGQPSCEVIRTLQGQR